MTMKGMMGMKKGGGPINQHKEMAMGKKMPGMKGGGKVGKKGC